jgi:hypothetical protein
MKWEFFAKNAQFIEESISANRKINEWHFGVNR